MGMNRISKLDTETDRGKKSKTRFCDLVELSFLRVDLNVESGDIGAVEHILDVDKEGQFAKGEHPFAAGAN